MKKMLTVFLAVATFALGAVCVFQAHKLAEQKVQTAELRADAEQQSQQLQDLATQQERGEAQRRQLQELTDQLTAELKARQSATQGMQPKIEATPTPFPAPPTGTPDKSSNGFGGMLAKMMQDPEMKKFIRDQQRTMMDQLYSPLIKQMGLNPDEASKFKELLADNIMKGAEQATSLFGEGAGTNQTTALASLADQQKSLDDQLKAFLGDDRYALYKDYQQTANERTQLNLFKAQMGSDNPLTDQQTEQLLALMKEEKQTMAANGQMLPGAGQDGSNLKSLQAMLSGDQADKLMQAQETANQHVYDRARAILAPDQLDAFGKFQTNQLQMMRMGMSMARKMFAPDKSDSGTSEESSP
jgi:hypothetical protein